MDFMKVFDQTVREIKREVNLKVLKVPEIEQKASLIRTAGMNYLLEPGVKWGSIAPVKGVRDATVELLHILVAVHVEAFAGCKPLLDKTLGILVEGLIDTFISLFHENQAEEFKSLNANGFCQLMLEHRQRAKKWSL